MAADRRFNRMIRVNEDTAHMLSLVRDMIEAKYVPGGTRCLTDVGTIRLALEIAAASIGGEEAAARGVLTGTTTTVRDVGHRATTNGSLSLSPYVRSASG